MIRASEGYNDFYERVNMTMQYCIHSVSQDKRLREERREFFRGLLSGYFLLHDMTVREFNELNRKLDLIK